jgi:hypothetical protein
MASGGTIVPSGREGVAGSAYAGTLTAAGGESYLEFTGLTQNHYSVFGMFQLSVAQNIRIFANGDTNGTNYRRHHLYSDGSQVLTFASSESYIAYNYPSPAPFASIDLKLGRDANGLFYAHCENSYSDLSDYGKSFISVYSASAIGSLSSIRFTPVSGTFAAGSVFYLYKLVTA